MTIWVQDLGRSWCGHEWAISSERHDGIVYIANSKSEAVSKYEADKHYKGTAIKEVRHGKDVQGKSRV